MIHFLLGLPILLIFRDGSAPGPHHFSFREGLFSGECHKSEAFLVDGISDLLQREKVPGLTGRKKDLDLPPPLGGSYQLVSS